MDWSEGCKSRGQFSQLLICWLLTTPSSHLSLCLGAKICCSSVSQESASHSVRKAGETPEANCAQSQPGPWNLWLGCGCFCYCRGSWAVGSVASLHIFKPAKPLRECVSSLVWPRQRASQVPAPSPTEEFCLQFALPIARLCFPDCSISFAQFILLASPP